MGFLDDINAGISGAGRSLERGAAGLTNRLPEYDEAQQAMKIRQLAAFKAVNAELEDLALSSIEDPKVIGPKLKQLQGIAKGLGVPIPDELVDHYTNNPLSLGMSYDKELLEGASPVEQQQIKR